MGCCELRESTGGMANDLVDSDRSQKLSDGTLVWKPSHQHMEMKIKSIEESVWSLSKDRHWVVDLETSDILVKTLQRKRKRKNVAVASGYLRIDREVDPSDITKAILCPLARPSWDITVENLEVIKQISEKESLLRLVKKFPFINREFIVKSFVFEDTNTTNIVLYSADTRSISFSDDFIRGEIVFAYYKVVNLPDQTLFMCMEQVDNQDNVPTENSLLSSEFTQWIYSFKRFCLHN